MGSDDGAHMKPSRIIDISQPVFSNCPQYPDTTPRPAQVRWMYIHGVEQVNKDPVAGMTRYLDRYVYGPKSWSEFLALLGMDELLQAARAGQSIYDA